MISHRRAGRARLRGLRLRDDLHLIVVLIVALAALASAWGWLPEWVQPAAIGFFIIDVIAMRAPELVRGFRELRRRIPRLDPDYRRRRR